MTDPPHIAEIEKAIQWCNDHLSWSADAGALEPFLVRLLVIDAVSSYEKTIHGVVVQRAKHSCDTEFARYIEKLMEIHGRPFGATWRSLLSAHTNLYRDEFENSPYKEKRDAYDKIVKIRNNTAHGGHTDM